MPWKAGYTTSDEQTLLDADIAWPDAHRCAFAPVIDLSVASRPEGVTPADLQTASGQFGLQVGIRSLLEVLQRFGVRATFAAPAVIAELYPDTIEVILAHGHEVAAHGYKHEDVSQLGRDEERARIEAATDSLTRIMGQRPAGWYSLPRQRDPFAVGAVSPNTIDLLIDAGYTYMGNGLADDIPYYWVADAETPRALLTMPYYYHFDDQFFLMFPPPGQGSGLENPKPFLSNCLQEFDAQYERGRYFSMTLHPHIIGFGHRMRVLETILSHIQAASGVWNPTATECAQYWQAQYPVDATLRLEPSIWKDYPGSLS